MLRNREYRPEGRRRPSELNDATAKLRFYEHSASFDAPSWEQPTPRFETRKSASKWRKRFVTSLGQRSDSKPIAERLEDCGKGHQCHSGTCPSCLRLLRRWLILEGEALFAARPSKKAELAFFTLIPPFTRVAEGELEQLDLVAFKDRIAHTLKRHGLAEHWMLGGIDFSLNSPATDEDGRYWQPHLHAVVLCLRGRNSFRKKAKRIPNSDGSIVKVATVKAIKNLRNAIGYCLKAVFYNRIPYRTDLGAPKIRNLIMKPGRMIELATYLDAQPIQGRMYLRNVRRHGSRLAISCESQSSGSRRETSPKPQTASQRARLAA